MYTLLIVDDEPNILEGVRCMIKWEEFGVTQIETATTCADALARAIDCKPDIALIDVKIGNEYGYDLIKRMNSVGLKTKCVMMSGYGNFRFACEALRCNALDYLLKPIRTDKLEECIRQIVVEHFHSPLPLRNQNEEDIDPVTGLEYKQFPSLIRKILLMVKAEFDQNLTLKSIAQRFRMNATYLGQIFIKEMGMKFSEYLMAYRLHKASSRIICTDDTIASIAAEVGYNNLNYFYQHFHNFYNITPTEMRAKQSV